jgi:cytochrome c biogenesis protein CcmG/thiol:disulfide interchange protein DsbE
VLLRGLVVAVAAAAAVFGAARLSPQAARPGTVSTQSTSWQLPRLGGTGQLTLASLRGHPLVVNFFASWCTACQGELPGMATVAAQLKDQVTFAGVDSEDTGDGLGLAQRTGIGSWPLAADTGGADNSGLHDDLGVSGMPVTAFYDAAGRLVAVVPGALSEADLRARLHDLFGVAA